MSETVTTEKIRRLYVAWSDRGEDRRAKEFDAWLDARDVATTHEVREQVARDIERHHLGPDSGRRFDGRDAPDAAERDAFDEGLQVAARIARGKDA